MDQKVLFGNDEEGRWLASGAQFSDCRSWRWALWRQWRPETLDHWFVGFIGLNPSTADERVEDPTVRRCLRFARDWGGCGLVMLNAYGWRSTDPAGLWSVADPVGQRNDTAIVRWVRYCPVVVCARGVHCEPNRAQEVLDLIRAAGRQPMCLGVTKDGAPKHPLYLRADSLLVPYDKGAEK